MKKLIQYLIAANLILIFIHLLNRLSIVHELLEVFIWVILTPIIFGIFLFYLVKPLNDGFISKGMKRKYSAMLKLIISLFLSVGVLNFFGEYITQQLLEVKSLVMNLINDDRMSYFNEIDFGYKDINSLMQGLLNRGINILKLLVVSGKGILSKSMMLFSGVLLILLIFFFLLKDGDKIKLKILKYCPSKYKEMISEMISEGDEVLSTYIVGQAKVALSLAAMVYLGYKIIGMPSGGLLASITFVLAFIPFVGFLISMMVPYIIAITIGYSMTIKLSLLFIIAQTLKGRVVVPFIMGRTMNIHPLTDIFLVVGGAALGGPLAAFCIVPIYSLLKLIIQKLYKNGCLSLVDKIKKV